jgi:hypothetical protein
MFSGMLLAAIGMVLLTRIGVDTGFWTHVFPGELVISFGIGLTFGPMSSTPCSAWPTTTPAWPAP